MDNEDFKKEYLGSFSVDGPTPDRCPVCGRILECWSYEKAKSHIEKCTNSKNIKIGL